MPVMPMVVYGIFYLFFNLAHHTYILYNNSIKKSKGDKQIRIKQDLARHTKKLYNKNIEKHKVKRKEVL